MFDRDQLQRVEDAVADVRGDRLLLSLAIDCIEKTAMHCREMRDKTPDAQRSTLTLYLTEEQLDALAYAHRRIISSVRDLDTAFHGERRP